MTEIDKILILFEQDPSFIFIFIALMILTIRATITLETITGFLLLTNAKTIEKFLLIEIKPKEEIQI